MDWWTLPGPESVVTSITYDLRDGKNVVIYLPKGIPDGLRTAIRSKLDNDMNWWTFPCELGPTQDPEDWLLQYFLLPDHPPDLIFSLSMLLEYEPFRGRIIWLDEVDETTGRKWLSFLPKYASACRGIDPIQRTVFVLPLTAFPCSEVIRDDICLSSRIYNEQISIRDMQLYVSLFTQRLTVHSIIDELRCEIIAELAQWDVNFADRLMTKSFSELLEIEKCLIEEAQRKNWLIIDSPQQLLTWAFGGCFKLDGKNVYHSYLCFLFDKNELHRRIWRACIRVLFPFVEEQRQFLLERLKSVLQLPFVARYREVITDIHNLELSHIETILHCSSRFNQQRAFIERVAVLRKIRNAIAHGEIPDFALFDSLAVREPLQDVAPTD